MSNRAIKKMSAITSWENSKKAAVEAELKKIEVSDVSLDDLYHESLLELKQ